MPKKPIDKLFADKLGSHAMRPSAGAWDRIAKQAGIVEPPPPKSRRRYLPIWLLLLSFTAFGGWYWKHTLEEGGQKTDVTVQQESSDSLKEGIPQPVEQPSSTLIEKAASTEIPPSKQEIKAQKQSLGNAPANRRIEKSSKKTGMPSAIQDIDKKEILQSGSNEAKSLERQYLKALPFPLFTQAAVKPKVKYRLRVEITVPYRPKTESSTAPKRVLRRVMRNVFDD